MEVKNHKIHQYKIPISLGDLDMNKITVSNKVPLGKKGFNFLMVLMKPLRIMLQKMKAYRIDFNETKYMLFWKIKKNIIKKGFDKEAAQNEKHLKTKIESSEGKTNTNVHPFNVPEEGSQCICVLIILIDCVFRINKNYYPQVFLEEWKCIVKEKKIPKYITNDSDDSHKEESDTEDSDEDSNFEKEIWINGGVLL